MDIAQYKALLSDLCEKHNVKRLFVFGSVVSGGSKAGSDIDLAVEFHPMDLASYAKNYFALHAALEEKLNRPVDLIEWNAVTNPLFRQQVEKECELIYEG